MKPAALRKIRVNGIELHTIEKGAGDALVLVHGGLGDYRSWACQLESFSQQYRVVSYSRRYSYPNENHVSSPDLSVFVEADDLAALIDQLQLDRVHLVGHSYGALAALVLALKQPEMVRTLVIAEPPVHRLIRDVPGGEALFDQLILDVWNPVRQAFANGDTEDAIRRFTNGIGGRSYYESLPTGARASRLQNARAVQALTQSSDAFPVLARDDIQRLNVPTLIVEGEKTIRIHQLVDQELRRYIPGSELAIIANAAHGTPFDNPDAFNLEVLDFLSRRG